MGEKKRRPLHFWLKIVCVLFIGVKYLKRENKGRGLFNYKSNSVTGFENYSNNDEE